MGANGCKSLDSFTFHKFNRLFVDGSLYNTCKVPNVKGTSSKNEPKIEIHVKKHCLFNIF